MARTTLTRIIKTEDERRITCFVEDLWHRAESWGRFSDTEDVHITRYERHKLTAFIINHKTVLLRVEQGGHRADFHVTGPRYSDIHLIKTW